MIDQSQIQKMADQSQIQNVVYQTQTLSLVDQTQIQDLALTQPIQGITEQILFQRQSELLAPSLSRIEEEGEPAEMLRIETQEPQDKESSDSSFERVPAS